MSSSRKQEQDFVIEDGELVQYNGPGGDVVIPDHVEYIDDFVFRCCDDLISVTLPKGLRYIGSEAFRSCVNLKEVKVSENETPEAQFEPISPDDAWIVDAAFLDCRNLTTVVIPKGITGIDTAVFMNCPKLSSLTIPETVTSISGIAFDNVEPIQINKAEDNANCDSEKGEEEGEGGFSISISIGFVKEPTKPVIYGTPGSYAEQFAKENGMIFKKIQ